VSRRFQEEDAGTRDALRAVVRAVRFVKPFRGRFAVKGVLLFLTLLPGLLVPWPVKILIDHVIEAQPVTDPLRPWPFFVEPLRLAMEGMDSTGILWVTMGLLFGLLLLAGTFGGGGGERDRADARLANGYDTATRTENEANEGWSLCSGLLGFLDFRFTMRLTQDFNHHYRRALFERIQSLPMTAFDDERIGDAVYRVMYDTPALTAACYRILLTPVGAPLLILLAAGMIHLSFGDHPVLVWSALAFAPLAFFVSLPMAGILRRRSGESRRAGAATTSTAEEGIANILAVQSLGGEGRQRERFDEASWAAFGRYRSVLVAGLATVLLAAIPGGFIVVNGLLYVSDLVTTGELSRGDFALLFGYFVQVAAASVDLGAVWFNVQTSAAGLHRVFFLMDLPSERDREEATPLPPVREGIRLEHVDYDYPDGTPALRDVEVEARLGEVVALVGPAGAGKSTLAYLVPRFLDPTRGRMLFDGRDAATATLTSVRSQVAFVFQETVLFDATIADNIRVGRPDASDAEVRHAARMAEADEFIRRLPQGYETRLGRGGGKLSVGQRQRLSIARALVREAPVLILDEPTSALDPDTEQRLVRALRQASQGRLVLVVAHRLSTVRAADRILFVRDGSIIEEGSHDELVARPDGAYRRFLEMQTLGAA